MDIALLYKDFGRRLKKARKSAGLTQKSLADLVGLSRASITNIERGRQHIHVHTMFLICFAVGVHPSNLLLGMDLPQKEELNQKQIAAAGLSKDEAAWVEKILLLGTIRRQNNEQDRKDGKKTFGGS